MANTYFQFKQFRINQDRCAMKVTTDGCLFGAWVAEKVGSPESEVGSRMSEEGSRESEDGRTSPFTKKVLDIGTGTGLLSLMLAQKNPSLPIDAIEIDNDAFEQASQNINESPWAVNINVILGDAREFSFAEKYNVIISNPPFYDKELKGDDTKKNIARHDEGLLLPDLLGIIKSNLAPDGKFFLLLPYKRDKEIKNLLAADDLVAEQINLVRQTPRHDYFRIMLQGKLATEDSAEITINEITIKDKVNQYTPEFVSLLQDYYFHL